MVRQRTRWIHPVALRLHKFNQGLERLAVIVEEEHLVANVDELTNQHISLNYDEPYEIAINCIHQQTPSIKVSDFMSVSLIDK